jgi:hypothetical protein
MQQQNQLRFEPTIPIWPWTRYSGIQIDIDIGSYKATLKKIADIHTTFSSSSKFSSFSLITKPETEQKSKIVFPLITELENKENNAYITVSEKNDSTNVETNEFEFESSISEFKIMEEFENSISEFEIMEEFEYIANSEDFENS